MSLSAFFWQAICVQVKYLRVSLLFDQSVPQKTILKYTS